MQGRRLVVDILIFMLGIFAVGGRLWIDQAEAVESREGKLQRFEYASAAMGEPLRIILYAEDEPTAERVAQAALDRIQQLNDILSDYDPESELSRLCQQAGTGQSVRVSEDLFRVLAAAQRWSERTEGAFDMTVGPVVRLWRRARRSRQMPSPSALEQARQLVGYQNVLLDPDRQTVLLKKAGMRLDPGGIGAGYAIDEALRVVLKHGINRVLIDLGGDIRLGDPPPDRPGWRIGVPGLEPKAPPREFLLLARCAVATSGDAWQFVELGGRRYSHIIDPKTGMPLMDRCSVTVVAPDGLTADVLGTAVSVLGPEKGMKLVDQTPEAAAWMIQATEQGVVTIASSRWNQLSREKPSQTEKSSPVGASAPEPRTTSPPQAKTDLMLPTKPAGASPP
ncbi:MAG: FAD:protein FMN transferase [Thermoguttaceae bacterium]|nr:FAD:protein FMN transferase [Thermoguttaceae bacterium]MDW8039373.1 FAD:protein FMN transferase [Thermoguttaceae bacterium]